MPTDQKMLYELYLVALPFLAIMGAVLVVLLFGIVAASLLRVISWIVGRDLFKLMFRKDKRNPLEQGSDHEPPEL